MLIRRLGVIEKKSPSFSEHDQSENSSVKHDQVDKPWPRGFPNGDPFDDDFPVKMTSALSNAEEFSFSKENSFEDDFPAKRKSALSNVLSPKPKYIPDIGETENPSTFTWKPGMSLTDFEFDQEDATECALVRGTDFSRNDEGLAEKWTWRITEEPVEYLQPAQIGRMSDNFIGQSRSSPVNKQTAWLFRDTPLLALEWPMNWSDTENGNQRSTWSLTDSPIQTTRLLTNSPVRTLDSPPRTTWLLTETPAWRTRSLTDSPSRTTWLLTESPAWRTRSLTDNPPQITWLLTDSPLRTTRIPADSPARATWLLPDSPRLGLPSSDWSPDTERHCQRTTRLLTWKPERFIGQNRSTESQRMEGLSTDIPSPVNNGQRAGFEDVDMANESFERRLHSFDSGGCSRRSRTFSGGGF